MLLYLDNFGFWTTLPGTLSSTSGTVSITGGKLVISGSNGIANAPSFSATDTLIVNTKINITSAPSGNSGIVTFLSSGTTQCSLAVKSTGKLAFFRGSVLTGTQVGSDSTTSLTFDTDVTYHDIEIKVVIHNTTGSVEVRLNGNPTPEITATNVNTRNGSVNSADTVALGNAASSSATTRFDHFILMDSSGSSLNNFIGPVNVNTHTVTGAGNYTQFTPSTGSNWQNVDDSNPDGDSTYNASSTLNHIDSFVISDLPANTTNIFGAMLWLNAKRDDATTRGVTPVLRIGSTDYLGSEKILSSGYQYYSQGYGVSPATSTAFTVSEVNNMEIGYKVTT